ncbi:hypothetical protein SpCBS45565_g00946 [Spizellomyces sp. 'palustris']|nr:hypothetical protein SpCBS45565_g00946 [Spizellomyces sp. 'palustris']
MRELPPSFPFTNTRPNSSNAPSPLAPSIKRSASSSIDDQGPVKRAPSSEGPLSSSSGGGLNNTMQQSAVFASSRHGLGPAEGKSIGCHPRDVADNASVGHMSSVKCSPTVSMVEDALADLRLLGGEGSRPDTPTLSLGESDGSRPESPFPPDLMDVTMYGVTGMTAQELMDALQRRRDNHSDLSTSGTFQSPIPRDAPVLPIDLRYVADFARCHIKGSVNVNLPVLMLKRFRRGSVSSFQMSNFLTGAESKELYENWKRDNGAQQMTNPDIAASVQPASSDRVLVIYDDEMGEDNRDTEAWALINILAKGLAEDVAYAGVRKSVTDPSVQLPALPCSGRTIITYLRGGFRAFQEAAGADSLLSSSGADTHDKEGLSSSQTPHLINPSHRPPSSTPSVKGTPTTQAPPLTPLNIRSAIAGNHQRLGSPGSSSNSPCLTPEPGTPRVERTNALLGEASRQRKKSAFSINTTKLVPQNRARGQSVIAQKRLSSLSMDSLVPNGRLGAEKSTVTAVDGPPASALPTSKPFQLPEIIQHGVPINEEVTPPTTAHPASHQNYFGTHRRSISESRTSSTGTTNSSPHTSNLHTISPGPSTLPTPVEPVSEILPYLLLGSDAIPQSMDGVEQLKSLGVTHVLNMAQEVENKKVDESGQFDVKWCLAEDHAEHEIEHAVKEAVEWIDQAHHASPRNIVFVHCKAGRSRSATTVIAYLVVHQRMTLREAYDKVKQARPGVSPNLGFMLALLRIEKEVHGETSSVLDITA